MGMIVAGNGIETKVWILPYVRSSVDETMYVQSVEKAIVVTTVPDYEDKLIRLEFPDCTTVVLKADQLITAIKKCVL